jgi:F0F1-type ATP synthase assembly protein I
LKLSADTGYLLRMGWMVAFSTLIPLGLGLLLDRYFGTTPLFVLVLAAFGIIGGTIGIVRSASRRLEGLGVQPQAQVDSDSPASGEEDGA